MATRLARSAATDYQRGLEILAMWEIIIPAVLAVGFFVGLSLLVGKFCNDIKRIDLDAFDVPPWENLE